MGKKSWKDNPNSLINRWLNDPNPVGVCGKENPKGKRIDIKVVDNIEEILKKKS